MPPVQDCLQCGRCCEKWGWGQKGVIEDIIPWILADRQDILQHVGITLANRKRISGRDISEKDLPSVCRIDYWTDPDGRALTHCPFYRLADDGKVYLPDPRHETAGLYRVHAME